MRRTTLVYLLTFSLALNGATAIALLFFWWKSRLPAVALSLGEKPIRSFLEQDLSLTPEQSSLALSSIDRSKREAAQLSRMMGSKRMEMISLVSSSPVNRSALDAKMDEIGRVQSKIRSIAVNAVVEICEVLPKEAREKFGAYLLERGRLCDGCVPARAPLGDRRPIETRGPL